MLISMPTDTSTILGVFQAILALLGEKTGRIVQVRLVLMLIKPALLT
jgi:hypothetical protein